LLATPPATTGASTVLTDERIWDIQSLYLGEDGQIDDVIGLVRHVEREVAAQAGQVAVPEDVVRDAARYRWIRGSETDIASVIDKECSPGMWEYKAADELDAAIDAAMLAAPSPAKESK
jgi:hypothetical protein